MASGRLWWKSHQLLIEYDVIAPEGDHRTSENHLASLKCIDLSAAEGGRSAGEGDQPLASNFTCAVAENAALMTAMPLNAVLMPDDCLQAAATCNW